MNLKKKHLAFTLVEILVVITMIGILAIWLSRINFNRLSDVQKIAIETTKITSIIEEVRNNALIWRWVWVNLITPDNWRVVVRNNGLPGRVTSQYNISGYTTLSTWNAPNPYTIAEIRCKNINGWSSEIATNIQLIFSWNDISINWCSQAKPQIIEIDFWIPTIFKTISINTVSGVIETN